MPGRAYIFLGAISAAIAVGLGAYHAHGLEKFLAARELAPEIIGKKLAEFEVGVRYQMFHALGLILLGIVALHQRSPWLRIAVNLFIAGTLLFCGGLYYPVLSGHKLPWFLVPTGGLALILGWLAFAASVLVSSSSEPKA